MDTNSQNESSVDVSDVSSDIQRRRTMIRASILQSLVTKASEFGVHVLGPDGQPIAVFGLTDNEVSEVTRELEHVLRTLGGIR